jgi:predicted AlkP superfamily pyrophosphatase or phosphodiesterase
MKRNPRFKLSFKLIQLALIMSAGMCTLFTEVEASPSPEAAPQLIIVISVDQFSAALFNQHRSTYTQGLRRLIDQGVVFPEAYQSHAATETCPGHSTLLTGRHPSATGIVANNWIDRATESTLYCVTDPSHPVPGRPNSPRGPSNLKVSTFGEWLKQANPQSRVFGVSGKDRAAITMTGHHPDGVYWWDDERGFTTSVPVGTEEQTRLQPVAGFNKTLFERWDKQSPSWVVADQRCLVNSGSHRYGSLSIDHRIPPPGAGAVSGQAFTLNGAPAAQKWLRASPVLDQTTLDLAVELIHQFHLGQQSAPDLLTISLSATDYIGHRYGSQGPEMCDQIAHLDQSLGQFMDEVTRLHVPAVMVLTADHGSVDAAERVSERAFPATRIDVATVMADLNASLRKNLRVNFDPMIGDGQQLYLSSKVQPEALRQKAIHLAVERLRQMPEVVDVFTATQLAQTHVPARTLVDELTLAERFAESFDVARSGDISVAFQAGASFGDPKSVGDAIAGHGSPWNYDRRVPLVFWRPGSVGFEQPLPVETVDIAPTLANLIGLKTPALDGRCLDLNSGPASTCSTTH